MSDAKQKALQRQHKSEGHIYRQDWFLPSDVSEVDRLAKKANDKISKIEKGKDDE
jgi:hypothetical protein